MKKVISIRLDEETSAWLKLLAQADKVTVSSLINTAIKTYITERPGDCIHFRSKIEKHKYCTQCGVKLF